MSHVVMVIVVAFSLLARMLGECLPIHSQRVLFFVLFFEVVTSSHILIPFFMSGSVHSGQAS